MSCALKNKPSGASGPPPSNSTTAAVDASKVEGGFSNSWLGRLASMTNLRRPDFFRTQNTPTSDSRRKKKVTIRRSRSSLMKLR